jgi:SAM-dependent methyltransferase
MHHHHLMDSWRRLDEAVRSGRPVRGRASFEDPEVRRHFLMGMFNLAMQLAPRVAAVVDLSACRHLLDLGGGPGTYAIHFCQRYRALQATVYDLTQTQPVAMETITRFAMADRIGFHTGDYLEDPLPGNFDAAWLSHILHAEGPQACRRLIGKVFEALNPGGLILIHDFFLNDTMDGPLFPALFALNMLLGTGAGQAYSRQQVKTMLADAGFEAIRELPLESPNDSGIIQGGKPAEGQG